MSHQKPTLPPEIKRKLVYEVLHTMNFDMSRLEHVLPLFEIFQLPQTPRPDNLKSLKQHIVTWFAQKFSTIEYEAFQPSNIDHFLSIKYAPNDEVRSYAATLLYTYRKKVDEEGKKHMMGMPETYQPMPGYMGYPPYPPYMMGSPYMMGYPMYPPQPPEGYEKYYPQMGQMSHPYHMGGMPMGYPPPPQMYGNGSYPMPRGEQSSNSNPNPYRYPPYYPPPPYPQTEQKYSQPPPPPPQQNEKKPDEEIPKPRTRSNTQPLHPPEPKNIPTSHRNANISQKSAQDLNYQVPPEQISRPKKSDLSLEDYHKNYEKFQEHEKKRYDREGPFKILLPEGNEKKQKKEKSIQSQEKKHPEPPSVPKASQPESKESKEPKEPSRSKPVPPKETLTPISPKAPVSPPSIQDVHEKQKSSQKNQRKVLAQEQNSSAFNFMREMDPLTSVVGVIKQNKINSIMNKEDFSQEYDIENLIQNLNSYSKSGGNSKYEIEVRCMKIDDASSGVLEYTWPDQTILFFEKQKICDFPALQYNSSLKKRKDSAILLTNCIQCYFAKNKKAKSMKVPIGLSNKTIPIHEYNSRRIKNNHVFIMGLYFVKKNTVDQLFSSMLHESTRVRFIQKFFEEQALRDDDIKVEKIKVSMLDPFSWDLIEVPARGAKCKHGQSFDLRKFITLINAQKNKTWKCPVCSKYCQKFVIDQQQLEVLKVYHEKQQHLQQKQQLSGEVIFTYDGKTHFQVDVQKQDDQNNESSSAKLQKERVKLIKENIEKQGNIVQQ